MHYALIGNGNADNIISLNPCIAGDFPNAVDIGERTVRIGDCNNEKPRGRVLASQSHRG